VKCWRWGSRPERASGGTSGTYRTQDTAKSHKARDRNPDQQARKFEDLVDRDGTGNITELSRETGRDQVRFTGDHYASIRGDTTVINTQAQPVRRSGAMADLAERVVRAALTA
jgi:hypothetical protein